jgi:hypothetical protein
MELRLKNGRIKAGSAAKWFQENPAAYLPDLCEIGAG